MVARGRWDIRVSGCKFPNRRTGLSALIATVNISTTQIIYKPELAVFWFCYRLTGSKPSDFDNGSNTTQKVS
jgi:hypothetical protein